MSRGTTLEKKKRKFMQDADAFVGGLARDLYVARYAQAGVDAVPEEAMNSAVRYFQALQRFGRPTPAQTEAAAKVAVQTGDQTVGVDANGSPVTELEG